MTPRVLVLGASRYNVLVVRAIREGGFFTVVADGNDAAPGLRAGDAAVIADIRDAAAVREIARAQRVDGIVPLGEAGVRAASRASEDLGLPTITTEAAWNATSKVNMRRCWDAIPEYSVPWQLVREDDRGEAAVEAVGGYPVIVKPDRTHGGSRGVSRADDGVQLEAAIELARGSGMTREVLVEKFITSLSEHSAEVLIHGGEVAVVAVGEKVKTRGRFRVDLSVRYPADVDVQQMCSRAVETLGLTRGPAHIEFAITERGPMLIELGARAGGGHTPLLARHVSGVDEAVAICRMATGQDPGPLRPVFRRGAEYRFLTFPPGTLAEAIIPEEVRAHPAVVDVDILVPPGGTLRDVQTGSDRAGFVVTIGETRDEAVRVADWAAGEIRVRYADGEVRRAF
jgi:biotin carboxylase